MTKDNFRNYIREAKFRELFNSLGWNNYKGYADFDQIIDEVKYDFKVIATIKGYQVIVCETDTNITASFCKRLDYKIRSQAQNYILIFRLPGECHHVWAVPVKKTEKRDMVLVEYHTLDQTDLLFSKLDQLTFPLGKELNIVDVIAQVQGCFEVNSEKITKDFYSGFQKQHTAFCKFISGIDDEIADKENKNKQWYTSVMLNRLMFCYFIQKKGFLDGDKHYLRNKLAWSKMMQGNDQFFSFYKSFLLQLFYDGINTPLHTDEFKHEFGRIPYLNGGMFDKHQLELDYADIDIKDEAFEQLFAFFDKWEWHLDTRVTASGRDINPDVLGYIFEQYINDRAQMGAYYTKEDITEYIGKNCILPFLMDRLKETDPDAFKANGYVWKMLRESGDRYIYDAVKKGVEHFDEIPTEIAKGIDTTQPNLLERRSHWNEKTPDTWALPTEIWRESIERMQRCRDIKQKIANGEIHEINDFITYNLDIRQFVQDLLEKTDDHLMVLHFDKALTKVTILDPTCGSGAFLFAAMNILEPLYEICIARMREFNAENPNLFKMELEELDSKYRSNVQYFIYKTIILHNLYGVDIMHEAVEIAKLRLFLKMVAVVEVDMRAPNLGLDPLPDIDFNIRCGNTLVGYATEEQLNTDLQYGDMFANLEFREKIEGEMDKVSHAFNAFRMLQLSQDAANMQAFKIAKKELSERLTNLNTLLNKKLFVSNGAGKTYEKWLADVQPFHWLAEYYGIIHGNGGFDVIIGNPPYVEYEKKDKLSKKSVSDLYKLDNYKTIDCGNLYAFVIERVETIRNGFSKTGMIIPHSSVCTDRMSSLCDILNKQGGWFSMYDTRPAKLFDGVDQRLLIYVLGAKGAFTTKYYHWNSEYRTYLFDTLQYTSGFFFDKYVSLSKISSRIEGDILKKILKNDKLVKQQYSHGSAIYYHGAPRYFTRGTTFAPYFYNEKHGEKLSVSIRSVSYDTKETSKIAACLLSSSLFYFWFVATSDCRHLNSREVENFPLSKIKDEDIQESLCKLCDALMKDFEAKKYRKNTYYKATGNVVYDEYYPKLSKHIIDEIDTIFARHFKFSEEELDFIINIDVKFRMSGELNDE